MLSVLEVLIERQGTDVGWRHLHSGRCITSLTSASPQIVPFLGQISGCIPQLWEKAASEEGEWLFKSSLLSLATKMVEVHPVDLPTTVLSFYSLTYASIGAGISHQLSRALGALHGTP